MPDGRESVEQALERRAANAELHRIECLRGVEHTSKSGRKFRFAPTDGNPDAARLMAALIACDGRTAKIPARFKRSK